MERSDALDLGLQVGESRTDADQLAEAARIEVRFVLHLGGSVDPPVTATGRKEQAGSVRRRDGVQRVPDAAEQSRQRGVEQDLGSAVRAFPLAHLDAQHAADRAVGAVGGEEVLGSDAAPLPTPIVECDLHSVHGFVDGDNLRAQLESGRRQRVDVPAQDVLEPILRDDGRCAGTDDGRLLARGIPDLMGAAVLGAGQRLALPQQHVGIDGACEDLVFEVPGAHELHPARAEGGCAREVRRLHTLLDEQGVDAVAPERDRRGEAGRTGADNENVNIEGDHRNSIGHAVFRTTACLPVDIMSSEM